MDALVTEVARLQERYPQARVAEGEGQRVLCVPGVPLPEGWSCAEATILVLLPVGFPHVGPDCFFADPELRLASGVEPMNSAMQPLLGRQYRWFSWHPSAWEPGERDSLGRYLRFCEARLREIR
jgi:hypothetical protein